MVIASHFLFSCIVCIHHKTSPTRTCGDLFALFLLSSLPRHPFTIIRSNLYLFAPIHTTFCINHQNMMIGEISPIIGLKSWPARPQMTPACLVFGSPVPSAPQRTHPHPFTSIYIISYPFTLYFHNVCMLI